MPKATVYDSGYWEMSQGHQEEAAVLLERVANAKSADGLTVIGDARQKLILLLITHADGDSRLVFNTDEARFVLDQIERAIETMEGRPTRGNAGQDGETALS